MYEISYYIIVGCGVAGVIYYLVAGGVTSCSGGVAGVCCWRWDQLLCF